MPVEVEFLLQSGAEVFKLRVHRFARPADLRQLGLRQAALFALRVGLELGDPEAVRVGRALERALTQPELFTFDAFGDFDHFDHFGGFSPSSRSQRHLELLADTLTHEFDFGRISVERVTEQQLTDRREAFQPEIPPLPRPPREDPSTFFEVRFVDEVGQAINGVQVEYQVDGSFRDVTTNAAGVALLEGASAATARVAIAEAEELANVLEPRWTKRRPGSPPREGKTTKLVFDGSPVGPIAVGAVVPHTVVIEPPRGRLFVELLDKTGRVRHANCRYTITGPDSLAGTTDDQGRLVHEAVFPGDYELTLTVEHFKGDPDQVVDTLVSPLIVFDPTAAEPEVRLVGAVPRCLLARLDMFFNTNKTFLLPTALPSITELRKLYLANNPSKLLVVGHADTAGGSDYNDKLSLERAEATIAYLKDDVEGWYKFYADSIDRKKRWGRAEDHLMLISMPDFRTKPQGEDPVEWYQRTRDLDVDGKAGKDTRRKLIAEYMSLDGASLSELDIEIDATAHGCGEHFPLDDSGENLDAAPEDHKRDPIDRRVELFFFDPEFGIAPAPPGKNSKAGSAEYPKWRERVAEVVELRAGDLDGPKVTFIELVDSRFRTNSAVVLPEGERPANSTAEHESLTSVGGFATLLRFNEENPGRKLLIAGHCDTTADVDFNQKLSEERAQCALAVLTGDRESFKNLCQARHKPGDYKQILSWVSHAFTDFAFDCDPGKIDDNAASAAEPVRRFQTAYNVNKAAMGIAQPDISVDGSVGKQTWGALFDCYEFALQQELGEDPAGVASLRELLVFVDDEHKTLGFSEHFPIEELGVDNYRSQNNRRVEMLLFEPGEEPDVEHAKKDPETSDIYLPGQYKREPIERPATGRSVEPAIGVRVPTRFSVNKSFPKPSAIPALRAALDLMRERPELQLVIVGHADPTGTDADNQTTSLARAEAIRAWLSGDAAFFAEQFSDKDPRRSWDWEEVQWMLYALKAGDSPCYIGQADGFPGDRTEEALGSFQLTTEDLAVSYAADDATVSRLISEYVALVGEEFVDAARIEVVGAGSWHPPERFAGGKELPEEPEIRDLRRVELFLFTESPRPPVSKFPKFRAAPTVYKSWCAQVGEEVLPESDEFHLEAYDAEGVPLANVTLQMARIVDDASRAPLGTLTTNSRGIAASKLPPGLYVAQVQVGAGEALVASAVVEPDATCGVALSFGSGGGLQAVTSE